MHEPQELEQLRTVEAELRQALQHQRAAYERMRETQDAVEELLQRARGLLERCRTGSKPAHPERNERNGR